MPASGHSDIIIEFLQVVAHFGSCYGIVIIFRASSDPRYKSHRKVAFSVLLGEVFKFTASKLYSPTTNQTISMAIQYLVLTTSTQSTT
jgi:hypothetical protein